jgi:hypothetical protein
MWSWWYCSWPKVVVDVTWSWWYCSLPLLQCLSTLYTATNLFNSYSNDMLTVKLSGFPDMHWRDFFTSTRRQVAHYYLVFKHSLHVIRRNLKIPIARVSRFVDWCAVMTLESFSCVFCQSKEFDRVYWLTGAQSTRNCGVCQVSFYVPKWL